jgi:hypothetical protein
LSAEIESLVMTDEDETPAILAERSLLGLSPETQSGTQA